MRHNSNPKYLAAVLFQVSEEYNILNKVRGALLELNNLVSSNGHLRVFVQSKKIDRKTKAKVFNQIFGKSGHPLVNETISYLQGSRAIKDLREIFFNFESRYKKVSNILEVKGTVAFRLSEVETESLKVFLDKILGKKTELSIEIDPSLIGGIKLRIDNTFLDASIQNQLQRLQTELLQI